MGKKDEYCATMESEIKNWDTEVDNLNAKGKQMSADARAGYDTQLKAMRADRDLAYSNCRRCARPMNRRGSTCNRVWMRPGLR